MKHLFELYDDEFWIKRCQHSKEYIIGWDHKHVFVKSLKLNKIVHYFKDDLDKFCAGILTLLDIESI